MALPTLLRTADIAKAFGVSPETIENWARSGNFPAGRKIGGSRFWTEDQVTAWLAANDAPAEKQSFA